MNKLNLLNYFWDIGLIKGFIQINNKFKIFLNYTSFSKSSYKNIKFFSKNIRNKVFVKENSNFFLKMNKINFFILIFYKNILLSFNDFFKNIKYNKKNRFFLFCKIY